MQVAKAAVAIPIRLLSLILFPQQQQGHARLALLSMDTRPIRLRASQLGRERWGEQLALERHIVKRRRTGQVMPTTVARRRYSATV